MEIFPAILGHAIWLPWANSVPKLLIPYRYEPHDNFREDIFKL